MDVAGVTIERTEWDQYSVICDGQSLDVDLSECQEIMPPYPLHPDQMPNASVTFGLDVLGGASGFSAEEASTGMMLNFNGNLMLIDCISFVDQHLLARGLSKNQVSSVLLTHLHDDHCNMFPMMLAPRRIELLTTREVYEMLLIKLSMALGWLRAAVAECFEFIESVPGQTRMYFGLEI